MGKDAELSAALKEAGWSLSEDGGSIFKTFRFADFRAAMGWMVRASFEAEDVDHHPEWRNVYNRVEVTLTTHDTGGLTAKDIDLATRFEKIAV